MSAGSRRKRTPRRQPAQGGQGTGTPLRGDLGPAHRGYAYQDLATAFALAQSLVEPVSGITVDRKLVAGDKFDDISVRDARGFVRRQLKWSDAGTRALTLDDFVHGDSALRIDLLVESHLGLQPAPADEYRLCVAWSAPDGSDSLRAALRPASVTPSLPGAQSACFRIDAERVWPATGAPAWRPLVGSRVTRAQFADFADRFVIETDTPPFSSDLSAPGPLERLLIDYLVDRIGVGEYPNQSRDPCDVAARLIVLATAARTIHRTLSPSDIAREIALRVDDGRVPQRFPVEADRRVRRDGLQTTLRSAVAPGATAVLVGPPGSGKSWALTELVEDLKSEGYLVARHYCYLAPGDPDVERRVTTNALMGNLISELLDLDPSLREAKERAYASTRIELEQVLAAAATKAAPRPVVLVVDGIDHISRILHESHELSRADTEIVEELATLALPAGACLVLGSQPGIHLARFEGLAAFVEMPRWNRAEVSALATRLGLREELVAAGGDAAPGLDELGVRSEGNPLYATFLIREFRALLDRGDAVLLVEWLAQAPPLRGDIANYYLHVYERLGDAAQMVADVLGVIDFAVTESELAAIFPASLRRHIESALRNLRPILEEIAGRGGIRIFHESFRRFVVERLRAAGVPLDQALSPVISWLDHLGFFGNGKAFRYLLPALRRAGRTDRIFELVASTFVSDAVAAGHARLAVEANLTIAAHVAAHEQRWPELARLCELYRAAHTCFEEKLYDPLPYWETFAAVAGPEALADRLLFEGRPTLDKHLGIVLCSLVDDAGAVAPWEEYFRLPPMRFSGEERRRPGESWYAIVAAAILHGHLRVSGEQAARNWLLWVFDDPENLGPAVVIPLARRMQGSGGAAALDAAIQSAEYPPEFRAGLLTVRARARAGAGDAAAARADAASAYVTAPAIGAEAARRFGVVLPARSSAPDPTAIPIGLDGARDHVDPESLRAWVSAVGEIAFTTPGRLAEVEAQLVGDGWYRGWLRAVLLICRSEAIAATDVSYASELSVQAFEELARDTRPFVGRPSASWLTPHRGTILETLARGLDLLRGSSAFRTAVDALGRVIRETSSELRGTPTGPILPESLGELLLPFASEPAVQSLLRKALLAQVLEVEAGREYFSNLADVRFVTARGLAAIGERAEAMTHWHRAAVYLTAYGMRKDVTFFEVLEGVDGLRGTPDLLLDALERLQPLADAVIAHTDGKSTRHAPNQWFEELARADRVAAVSLLARSAAVNGGRFDWRIEEAAHEAVRACASGATPHIVACAQGMLRFDVEDARYYSSEQSEWRILGLGRLAELHASAAQDGLRRLAAQIQGDNGDPVPKAEQAILDFAHSRGLALGALGVDQDTEAVTDSTAPADQGSFNGASPAGSSLLAPSGLAFRDFRPEQAVPLTPLALMTEIHRALGGSLGPRDEEATDRLVNRVGYACLMWLDHAREEDVTRLIRFLARDLPMFGAATPLAHLGEGFDRFGHHRLAALAFTLAFAHSRGGRGWDSLGGDGHLPWLDRARALNDVEARATLATEILHILDQGRYVLGITPGIVRRTAGWGEHATAAAAWNEAYSVVLHRLPSGSRQRPTFLPFRRADTPPWSSDEALLALALGRTTHPELVRRRLALLAFAEMVRYRPDAAARPLAAFLAQDVPGTSFRAALQVLDAFDSLPETTLRSIEPVLRLVASSQSYGDRLLARRLLARVGIEVGGVPPDPPSGDGHLSAERERAILALDTEERIEELRTVWPPLPRVTATRFERLWETSMSKARAQSRYDAYAKRDRSSKLWTPFLTWEHEVFETALHEAANGLTTALWTSGQWSSDHEDEVLRLLLPNVKLQLAIEASRSPRPQRPRPQKAMVGVKPAVSLGTDDEFSGWISLAYTEQELIAGAHIYQRDPTEMVWVIEGTLVAGLAPVGPTSAPVVDADPDTWFDIGDEALVPPILVPRIGPLCGASYVKDLLGTTFILVPAPRIAALHRLRPAPWPGRLAWVDETGAPAVVLRVWRVGNVGRQASGELPVLEGCDLIARPDLVDRLTRRAGLSLHAISNTHRTPIRSREARDP